MATAIASTLAPTLAQLHPPFSRLVPWLLVAGLAAATTAFIISLRRKSAAPRRLLLAACGFFCGLLIAALGVAHLAGVFHASLDRACQGRFVYGFHFYSLVLLGTLLVAGGIAAAGQASKLALGERAAWRASLVVWAALLFINLPLVPLQDFAALFSALAALYLMVLYAARRSFA